MNEEKLLNFLYNTTIGRVFLNILVSPVISKIVGKFMDTKVSSKLIPKFIKKNNIDMSEFEEKEYKSFNEFFTRNKKSIAFKKNKHDFISPCDGFLSVYKINENSAFEIKKSIYTIESLIENKKIADEFLNGDCLIFRLSPKDYHRYCYIDNGEKINNTFIKGTLHTVRPIALENYKVFQTNSREWTILKTENFDEIIQIEVGALLVGKINNYHQEGKFKKGEEKGKFEYGGSTIVLLIKENKINIEKEILKNSEKNIETIVKIGQKIGKSISIN